jgi:hypothetical protein
MQKGLIVVAAWGSEYIGIKVCDKCGQKYKVWINRFPNKDDGEFHCKICGELMESWNSTESPSYSIYNENQQ